MVGLGLVAPFVQTNPRNAASLGFPAFGAAFQSMTQARLESIDYLPRGGGFDLRTDQSAVDVEVRLRDHSPGHCWIGGSLNLT